MNLMGAMANIEFQRMGPAISFGFPTIPFGFIVLPLAADLDDGWGPALLDREAAALAAAGVQLRFLAVGLR
jgi:hypothetical protein